MDINAIHSAYGVGISPTTTTRPAGDSNGTNAASGAATGFGEAFKRALDGVNTSQKNAENLTREFQMENPNVSLEETMVAMTKANVEFQALLQVRNKVISAYNEIMNMQV